MEKPQTFHSSAITSWPTHESRNPVKAHKRRLSIARQLSAGASIDKVRTKIIGLYRQSTRYMGDDSSFATFLEQLGVDASSHHSSESPRNGHITHVSDTAVDDEALDEYSEDCLRRVEEIMDVLEQTYQRTKIL